MPGAPPILRPSSPAAPSSRSRAPAWPAPWPDAQSYSQQLSFKTKRRKRDAAVRSAASNVINTRAPKITTDFTRVKSAALFTRSQVYNIDHRQVQVIESFRYKAQMHLKFLTA